MGLCFRDAFGYHEGALEICFFPQIANNHLMVAVGGMDHLAVSQVNSHMVDMAAPIAEKEEVSREQSGKIQGAGDDLTLPGLLGAGARQVNIGLLIDKLHKS